MSTIDLAPFCGKDDARQYLNAPFSVLGGTGASNGHIFVWLAGQSFGKPLGSKESAGFEALIARAGTDAANPDAQWVAVDTIRTSSCRCGQCEGTGVVQVVECEDCDGDGYFAHGLHDYECKECNGVGHKNVTGIGEQCDGCDGTGKSGVGQPSSFGVPAQLESSSRGFTVESHFIDRMRKLFTVESHFIDRMRKLPGCKIKRYDSRPSAGLTFVFDGGVGVVMPYIKNPIEAEAQP